MPMLKLDTGNTGFMLLCSSLVMLMTPGLAFFYGGLVGRKNVLAIMIQSFVSMCWTTVLWLAFGFSVCFSGDLKSGTDFFGILGNFHWAFLRGITLVTPSLINHRDRRIDQRRCVQGDPAQKRPVEVTQDTEEVRAALHIAAEANRKTKCPPKYCG